MQALIVRTVCAFGVRKAARTPARSKLHRKQLHLGCVRSGRDGRFLSWGVTDAAELCSGTCFHSGRQCDRLVGVQEIRWRSARSKGGWDESNLDAEGELHRGCQSI